MPTATVEQRFDSIRAVELASQAACMTVADAQFESRWGFPVPISGDHLRSLPGRISVWDVIREGCADD